MFAMFQFLIGTVKTNMPEVLRLLQEMFQFLIGTVKTKGGIAPKHPSRGFNSS